MRALSGYIRTGVSLFGGCLLIGALTAHAQEKIKETPFVVEAVPGEAIVAVASGYDSHLLVDGTQVTLSNDKSSLIVTKDGREIRKIALLREVYISSAIKNSVLVASYSNENRIGILVHIPTGRRTEIPGYDGGMSSYDNLSYSKVAGKYLIFDFQNGKILEARSSLSTDRMEINSLGDSSAASQLFHLKGAKTFAQVGQKGEIRLISIKEDKDFSYCRALSSELAACEARDNANYVVSYKDGALTKVEADVRIYGKHSTKNIVLAQERGGDQKYLAVDPFTKTQRELLFKDNGWGSFISTRRVVDLSYMNGILGIIETRGLMGGQSYELRRYSQTDIDQIIDSTNSIDQIATLGTSLVKSEDWSIVMDRARTQHIGGGWSIENLAGNAVRIYHSSRPHEARVVYLGSNASARKLGETGFASIDSYSGNVSTSGLMDLQSGRMFMLESSNWGRPQFSEEHQTLVVNSQNMKMVYSIPLLKMSMRSRTRYGVGDRPNATALAATTLQECTLDAGAAKDAVVDRLLELRQPGISVTQDEMQNLLTYRLGGVERALVAQIFQRLLLEEPAKAELMFHKFQLYDRLEGIGHEMIVNPCFDDYMNKALLTKLDDVLKFKDKDGNPRPVSFTQLQPMLVYAPFFKKFSLDNDYKKEQLAERLATGAQNHPMASGIFYSKLYYFASSVIQPLFGKKRSFKTDITVLVDGRNIVSHLLTTYPTTKTRSVRSSFGFFMTTIERSEIPEDARAGQSFPHSVAWDSNGRQFRADIKVEALSEISDTVPADASADHAALRKDGELTGLMIVGTNLGRQHTERTMSQYRFYYMSRGYTFSAETEMADFPSWFQTQVEGGELDYFIKEAHSDGDEKNLFRASKKARVLTGKKAAAPGKAAEIVYLIAPIYGDEHSTGESALLSNQLFGDWMRKREATGLGPLVYLNASCSSYYKAIRELSATRSKSLVMVPSITAVSMFSMRANNATAIFVDGLLDGKDWASIRKAMDEVDEVKLRQNNFFALPNDPEFDQYIRKALGVAIDSHVNIFDRASGQPINIDEFNAH